MNRRSAPPRTTPAASLAAALKPRSSTAADGLQHRQIAVDLSAADTPQRPPERTTPERTVLGSDEHRPVVCRRALSAGLAFAVTTAITCVAAAPASAAVSAPASAVVDHGAFVIEETFGPEVISDLPCLLGKQFVETGSAVFRGTIVDLGTDGIHFSQIEKFDTTLVPVDGQGPTYIESGAAEVTSLDGHFASGMATFTNVNNDNYIAYEGGKVVGADKIRIHEMYHVVVMDTNGDGQPDNVAVEFDKASFSCP